MKKAYLSKLKAKMPTPPVVEDEDDMLEMDEEEAAESPEHEAGETSEEEAAEHEEGAAGLEEGTPEEEAAETEEQHTAELSDEALLAEIKKRGLSAGGPKKKAVAVSPKDVEEETGY